MCSPFFDLKELIERAMTGKTAAGDGGGQGIGRRSRVAWPAEGAAAMIANRHTTRSASVELTGVEARGVLNRARPETSIERRRAELPRASTCSSTARLRGSRQRSSTATEEKWAFSNDLNVTATVVYRLIAAFLPKMLETGTRSDHRSTCSSYGVSPRSYGAEPGRYAPFKAASSGITKSRSRDFSRWDPAANAICPGTVESPSWHRSVCGRWAEAIGDISTKGGQPPADRRAPAMDASEGWR